MSLDVYLRMPYTTPIETTPQIFIREAGSTRQISREEWDKKNPGREPVTVTPDQSETNEVYSANITHNLNKMADVAGLYQALWYPDVLEIETAEYLIPLLENGLVKLKSDRTKYETYNPPNGWGDYDGLVSFVSAYLEACRRYPEAKVSVSR